MRELRAGTPQASLRGLAAKFNVPKRIVEDIIYWRSYRDAGGPPAPHRRARVSTADRLDNIRALLWRTNDLEEIASIMGLSLSRTRSLARMCERGT